MGLRKRKKAAPFKCGHLAIDRTTKRCIICKKKVPTLKAWLKPPKAAKPKVVSQLRLGVKQCRNKVVENGHKLRCLDIWRIVRYRGKRRLATLCMGCRTPVKGEYAKLANKTL